MKAKKLGIVLLSMLCVTIARGSGGYPGSGSYPGSDGQSESGSGSSIGAVPASLTTAFTLNSPITPLSSNLSSDPIQQNWLAWLSYIYDRYSCVMDFTSKFFRSNTPKIMVTRRNAYPYSMPGTSPYVPTVKSPINGCIYTAPYYYVKNSIQYSDYSDEIESWCKKNASKDQLTECLNGYFYNLIINNMISAGFYDNAKYDRAFLTEIFMARLEGATSGLYTDSPARAGVLSGNAPYSVKFSKLAILGLQDSTGTKYSSYKPYSITQVFNQVKIMSNIVRNNLSTISATGGNSGGVATLSPLHTFAGFIVINNSDTRYSICLKDGSSSTSSNRLISIPFGSIGVLSTIDPANQIPSYQYTSNTTDAGQIIGQRSIGLGIPNVTTVNPSLTIKCQYSSNDNNEFPPYDITNSCVCDLSGLVEISFNAQLGSFFKTPQQWMAVVVVSIKDNKINFNLKSLIKVNTLDSPLTFVATTPGATSGGSFTFNERQLIQAPYLIYQDIYNAANTNDFARGLYNGYLEATGTTCITGNNMAIKNALTASYSVLSNMYFSPNAYFSNKNNTKITPFKASNGEIKMDRFIDMLDNPELSFRQTPSYQVVYNVLAAPAVKSVAPAVKSAAPAVKSAAPAVKSVAPAVKSAAPAVKSAAPAAKLTKKSVL